MVILAVFGGAGTAQYWAGMDVPGTGEFRKAAVRLL
jgi:hypothetical protein